MKGQVSISLQKRPWWMEVYQVGYGQVGCMDFNPSRKNYLCMMQASTENASFLTTSKKKNSCVWGEPLFLMENSQIYTSIYSNKIWHIVQLFYFVVNTCINSWPTIFFSNFQCSKYSFEYEFPTEIAKVGGWITKFYMWEQKMYVRLDFPSLKTLWITLLHWGEHSARMQESWRIR